MMDTDALIAFAEVAKTQSFTKAAAQLFITQPAVSKRIANLEEQLNTPLFIRINRTIVLSPAGQALLPRAKKILTDINEAQRAISSLSGKVDGQLTMATSHHIGLHRLPKVLKSFVKRHPDVALDIRFIDSEDAYSDVLKGDIEIGIVTLPPDIVTDTIAVPIWPDPLSFIINPEHPLSQVKQPKLSLLAQYSAILPSQTTFTRKIVERLFAEHGLDIDVAISTNYLETIKMLVSTGLGWSVLPTAMLDEDLHKVSLPGVQIQRTLGYVHHGHRPLSNAAQAMLAVLAEYAIM